MPAEYARRLRAPVEHADEPPLSHLEHLACQLRERQIQPLTVDGLTVELHAPLAQQPSRLAGAHVEFPCDQRRQMNLSMFSGLDADPANVVGNLSANVQPVEVPLRPFGGL